MMGVNSPLVKCSQVMDATHREMKEFPPCYMLIIPAKNKSVSRPQRAALRMKKGCISKHAEHGLAPGGTGAGVASGTIPGPEPEPQGGLTALVLQSAAGRGLGGDGRGLAGYLAR